MRVIPQEFERVARATRTMSSSRNSQPTEIWKTIKDIEGLRSRPYIKGTGGIDNLLAKAIRQYETALSMIGDPGHYTASEKLEPMRRAADALDVALRVYTSAEEQKTSLMTMKEAYVSETGLDTGAQKYLSGPRVSSVEPSPAYGQRNISHSRNVIAVSKFDAPNGVGRSGIAVANPRSAQYGHGWELWIVFSDKPSEIWVVGRKHNPFTTPDDIRYFVRRNYPNFVYYGNQILFARAMLGDNASAREYYSMAARSRPFLSANVNDPERPLIDTNAINGLYFDPYLPAPVGQITPDMQRSYTSQSAKFKLPPPFDKIRFKRGNPFDDLLGDMLENQKSYTAYRSRYASKFGDIAPPRIDKRELEEMGDVLAELEDNAGIILDADPMTAEGINEVAAAAAQVAAQYNEFGELAGGGGNRHFSQAQNQANAFAAEAHQIARSGATPSADFVHDMEEYADWTADFAGQSQQTVDQIDSMQQQAERQGLYDQPQYRSIATPVFDNSNVDYPNTAIYAGKIDPEMMSGSVLMALSGSAKRFFKYLVDHNVVTDISTTLEMLNEFIALKEAVAQMYGLYESGDDFSDYLRQLELARDFEKEIEQLNTHYIPDWLYRMLKYYMEHEAFQAQASTTKMFYGGGASKATAVAVSRLANPRIVAAFARSFRTVVRGVANLFKSLFKGLSKIRVKHVLRALEVIINAAGIVLNLGGYLIQGVGRATTELGRLMSPTTSTFFNVDDAERVESQLSRMNPDQPIPPELVEQIAQALDVDRPATHDIQENWLSSLQAVALGTVPNNQVDEIATAGEQSVSVVDRPDYVPRQPRVDQQFVEHYQQMLQHYMASQA